MSAPAPVCAVIPAYNSRETIGEVVRGAREHLATVLVADDGSRDGTAEAARAAGAAVIALPENRGKGNALGLLFAEARRRGFSAVVALDADGQHDPADIPLFLAAHAEAPDAIVTGSRMRDERLIPAHRRNAMLVARYFICLAANRFIEDTQCGYRLYPLEAVASMARVKERYVTETEILIKAGDSGRPIRTIPIRAVYREGQKTHFRSVPDVAAIAVYVISYLMVKWWIELAKPGTINSYRGPGTGRDRVSLSPRVDRAFEVLTLLTCLPLSAFYYTAFFAARLFSIPVFRGLSGCGVPVGSVFVSTMALPLLLAVSILDLVANRYRRTPRYRTDAFVRKFYPNLWGA